MKTACLAKIWFSRYRAKWGQNGGQNRTFRLYLEKSPFVFWDFLHVNRGQYGASFSENRISGKNLVLDLQGRKACQIGTKWDMRVYFEIGWLYDHIRLISHLLDILQHLKSLKNSEVETSPFRTLQFSTQLSYEAKNSLCVRLSVVQKLERTVH